MGFPLLDFWPAYNSFPKTCRGVLYEKSSRICDDLIFFSFQFHLIARFRKLFF